MAPMSKVAFHTIRKIFLVRRIAPFSSDSNALRPTGRRLGSDSDKPSSAGVDAGLRGYSRASRRVDFQRVHDDRPGADTRWPLA